MRAPALLLMLLFVPLLGCASTVTLREDRPACAAAAEIVQPADAVFRPSADPTDAPRCDVSRFTIAVRDLGAMRAVYGADTGQLSADQIVDQVDHVVGAILERLCAPEAGGTGCEETVRLLIFAHGGMVSHEYGVLTAERLAPVMMADGYHPVFLIWNSDFATAYWQHLCCVNARAEPSPTPQYLDTTFRALGDVVSGVGDAPENYASQSLRFNESVWGALNRNPRYWLRCEGPNPPNCLARKTHGAGENGAANNVIYPPGETDDALNDMSFGQELGHLNPRYLVLFPSRVAATLASDIGAESWDNMVGRTQLAFSIQAAVAGETCADRTRTLAAAVERSRVASARHRGDGAPAPGGFAIFFDRLQCEIRARGLQDRVSITLVGHSMGALVSNELVSRYPDLPYERIIYMGAATSIRDFRMTVAPVLEEHADGVCDGGVVCRRIEFFNLMLHPLAESREFIYGGVVPEGSLLEWIDEMFEGPRSGEGRMLGKWNNVRVSKDVFSEEAQSVMWFRIFPAKDRLSGRKDDRLRLDCAPLPASDAEARAGGRAARSSARCYPITHGEFIAFSFWRDRFLLGEFAPDRAAWDADAAPAPP